MNDKKTIDLVFISDEEKIYDGKVSQISTQTDSGSVMILPEHIPYLSKIEGYVRYVKEEGSEVEYKIKTGFLYTNGSLCFIITDNK